MLIFFNKAARPAPADATHQLSARHARSGPLRGLCAFLLQPSTPFRWLWLSPAARHPATGALDLQLPVSGRDHALSAGGFEYTALRRASLESVFCTQFCSLFTSANNSPPSPPRAAFKRLGWVSFAEGPGAAAALGPSGLVSWPTLRRGPRQSRCLSPLLHRPPPSLQAFRPRCRRGAADSQPPSPPAGRAPRWLRRICSTW